jgi:hypothetical protein
MTTRNRTFLTLAVVACLSVSTNSAQAAITLVGSPDFSVSSASTSPFDDPGSYRIDPGTITPSTTMGSVSSYTIDKLADGNHTHDAGAWASASSPGGGTVTLTFPSTNVAGMTFDWAWGDRTPGDYEIVINGSTSLGTFNVDAAGGTTAQQSTEPITHILFDSVQANVTSIDINMSYAGAGNTNSWGSDEMEVFEAVPEPATMSLLAIGGLGVLLKRRRRRS